VPFHALPKLHEAIKADCPPPYRSCWDAYREIIPAVLRQRRDPNWCVARPLPRSTPEEGVRRERVAAPGIAVG